MKVEFFLFKKVGLHINEKIKYLTDGSCKQKEVVHDIEGKNGFEIKKLPVKIVDLSFFFPNVKLFFLPTKKTIRLLTVGKYEKKKSNSV